MRPFSTQPVPKNIRIGGPVYGEMVKEKTAHKWECSHKHESKSEKESESGEKKNVFRTKQMQMIFNTLLEVIKMQIKCHILKRRLKQTNQPATRHTPRPSTRDLYDYLTNRLVQAIEDEPNGMNI